jgi:hypothetical protein
MQISVKVDIDGALRELNAFQKDIERATTAALNKVAVTARAAAVRSIARETGLKQKEIRERLAIRRATRYEFSVEISAKPWAPNLIRFEAKQTPAGVSAKPWKQRKVYKGTFIANQGRTVFVRTSKRRLPIKAVYGPSVPREFMRDRSRQVLAATVKERFPLEFNRALAALASRRT